MQTFFRLCSRTVALRLVTAQTLAAAALGVLATASVPAAAYAEARAPAPISYASLGNSAEAGLSARPERAGRVIDVRRTATPHVATAVQSGPLDLTPAASSAREQETSTAAAPANQPYPEWLERERVGAPYQANGRTYVPTPEPGYQETGMASWYGPQFDGQRTASGEVFDQDGLTAAHPTLPIPSLVQVTDLATGRDIIVRVNDRGPFVGDRVLDLSRGAARALGVEAQGQARVHVRYLGPAPVRVAAQEQTASATSAPRAPVQPAAPQPAPQPEPARQSFHIGNVSAPAPAITPAGPFLVQVGAYSQAANAEAAAARLEGLGAVAIETRPGDALYRVRLGGWASEAEAEQARHQAAARGFPGAMVTMR